jgi:hypothetical protein
MNTKTFKLLSNDGNKLYYSGGFWMYSIDNVLRQQYPERFTIDLDYMSKQVKLIFNPNRRVCE